MIEKKLNYTIVKLDSIKSVKHYAFPYLSYRIQNKIILCNAYIIQIK